jgi:hypothetical protein
VLEKTYFWDTNSSSIIIYLIEIGKRIPKLISIFLVFKNLINSIILISIILFRICFKKFLKGYNSVFLELVSL